MTDTLRKNVTEAISGHNAMALALAQIARGRPDGGRPISSEDARQLARGTLTNLGMDWGQILKVAAEMAPAFERLQTRSR
jgi:hypothetical protein